MTPTRALLLDVPETVARRIGASCRASGLVLVERPGAGARPTEPLDLVMAEAAGSQTLTAERIREGRGLPGAPEVVALVEQELAPERAALLGAGCLAVLNWTVPEPELTAALRSIVGARVGR